MLRLLADVARGRDVLLLVRLHELPFVGVREQHDVVPRLLLVALCGNRHERGARAGNSRAREGRVFVTRRWKWREGGVE